jgi:hypothetical protein
MFLDERLRRHESAFERLLEQIESGGPPAVRIAPAPTAAVPSASVLGDEKLWPRWTEQARSHPMHAGAVATLYAEHQSVREAEPAPAPPAEPFDLAARAAQIRREFGKASGLEDLRRLRRRCALLAHPDRAPGLHRAQAEQFMAEINAAIDAAIKSRRVAPPKA